MRRFLVAVLVGGMAVATAAGAGANDPVEPGRYCGGDTIDVEVDGRPVQSERFETADEPRVVIDGLRRSLADAAVDLVEVSLEDGLSLSILDVHAGVHRVVSARRTQAGRTEVVCGASPLRRNKENPDVRLPLPLAVRVVSRVEDRLGGRAVLTWVGVSALQPAELEAELARSFRTAGWTEEGPLSWQREGVAVAAEVVEVEGTSMVHLRSER